MTTLTYLQVHIYYNIPPLILFWLLYRPLATNGDVRKYLFLVVIAMLYTTPWDNYIIYRKAWQYCPTCVMGTIGLVPVEEYIFFVTQTLMTCFIHSLLTRCSAGLPAVAIRTRRERPVVFGSLLTFSVIILAASWRDLKTFYMRAILLWTLPVLTFLFVISGIRTNFIYHRILATVASVLIPTIYLCVIDSIAICAGTWHINEMTSLTVFLWRGLPIEEAVFFLVTNIMVVLGCTGFDLAFSIVHTYDQTLNFSFLSLCHALTREHDEQVISDLAECVEVLKRGSSSFYTSSFFFNEAVRRDLIVLYAFCRYTDDITDDTGIAAEVRAARLVELTEFINKHFLPKALLSSAKRKSESEIKAVCDPIQRSMIRFISHKVPREPLIELLEGYAWDLNLDTSHDRRIRFEENLIQYSEHVASSVAEMCMFVIDRNPQPSIIFAARQMGVVLQLTNVARDILTDAMHGRVYVPEAWFKGKERALLLEAGTLDLSSLAHSQLIQQVDPAKHALRLLRIADTMHKHSTKAIDALPKDAQAGIKIATDGYFAIGQHLVNLCAAGPYPLRARLSRSQRLALALRNLYKPDRTTALLLGGCLLRFILLIYGQWQDNLGANVRFTDVDYDVFTDAARYVQAGGSPYERATYRYTPLLAWMLIPNQYYAAWGKLVFALGDILAGRLMISLLNRRKQSILWSAAWLLNPMGAVISTRGNCEGLLGAMAIALLYLIEEEQIALAGVILGVAVHFKIYPIIYAPSILWHLQRPQGKALSSIFNLYQFFNRRRLTFAITSFASFVCLSAFMFQIYGMDFLQHTFLYHISRSDHRHNFSPYHLFLYLSSAATASSAQTSAASSTFAALVAFLPQLLLSFIIIPFFLAWRNLTLCFFSQTFAFVAFNKVVTSQYFMWYLVFLPLYLPNSSMLSWSGARALSAWIVAQGVWLYYAYGFEMLGKNTFVQMWLATLLFFSVNVYILGKIVTD